MSEPTKKNDIIAGDVFSSIVEDVKKAEEVLLSYDDALRKVAKTMKDDFDKVNTKTIEGLSKMTKLQKEAEKQTNNKRQTQKQLTVIEQERLKLQKTIEKTQAQKILADQKEAKELQKLRAEKNAINKATRDEIKQTERSKNAYTKLVDETRELKNESKRLGAELLQLGKRTKDNADDWDKLEKEYTDVTRRAKEADKQFKILNKTVGDNQPFVGQYENALNGVSNVLGKIGLATGVGGAVGGIAALTTELSKATNQARFFFDTTEQGAQDIAKEASIIADVYNKEVNEVLISANALSKEFGIEGSAALELINEGFQKGGDTTGELLSNVSEYSTQLRLAGLNAEESISIITQSQQQGVFSDKGIDAIKEATLSLREMTLPAKEALESIGMSAEQVQKDIANGTKTYFDVIQEISAETNKFGEDSRQAGLILADIFKGAGEDAGQFIFSLDSMNTSLGELENQEKGVDGAVKELTRSFYEQLYAIADNETANNLLSESISFIARNMGTIIPLILRLGAYTLLYTQRVRIANTVTALFGSSAKGVVGIIPKMITGLKGLSFSFRGVGTAIKSIPFAGWIALATEAIMLLWDWIGATDEATETTEKNTQALKANNDEQERGNKIRRGRRQDLKDINTLSANLNELSKAELKTLKEKVERQKEEAQNNIIKLKTLKAQYEEEKRLVSQLDLSNGVLVTQTKEYKQLQETKDRINALRNAGTFSLKNENRLLDESNGLLDRINPLLDKNTVNTKKNTEQKDKSKESQDAINKSLEHSLRMQKLINEIEKEGMEQQIENADSDSSNALQSELDAIENGNLSIALSYKARIDAINETIDREIELRRNNAENAFEFDKSLLESERERIEAKEKLSQEDINRIKEINLEIELLEMQHQQELLSIQETGDEKKVDSKKQIDDKLIATQEEYNARQKELEDKLTKDELARQKELYSMLSETQQAITDMYSKQIDNRISDLDREAEAAREQQQYLEGLAESGNINAEQSITEERERELAALAEKERLEKRKATLQLITAGLEAFSSELENGSSPAEALAKTGITLGTLTDVLSNLNFFAEGTDYAPAGLAVVDEEGGEAIFSKSGKLKEMGTDGGARLTKLAAGDKVLTHPETMSWIKSSAMISNMTPMKQDKVGNSYDLLKPELREITKAIKNQPTNDYNIAKVAKGVIDVMKETKSGGDRRVSIHRVKY